MNSVTPVKRIALYGSTGSIGSQALEVIAANPDKFSVEVLTCHSNDNLLVKQALTFK
ncbi:MAG: 1-deoxy-D-xylulose-5-phosphate reductoisomerase, partial [Flavisolibacter sp.]|nr:1-deoxy-D-xylulose-5-phosphate reductoisomerase [Flavisolibacter sp.]